MSGWREVTLGDLCERITVGHVGKMTDRYVNDGVPFLRSQNVRPFVIERDGILQVDEAFHRKLAKSSLAAGDVVIVRTGYPGTAAVVPEDLDGSNCADLVVITPGKSLNPHVLAAVFNSAWGRSVVNGHLVGAAQQHFNIGAAKLMRLRLPPRPEQDRIAQVLCAFHDLIDNSRRRVELLEEMARAIYREWFVHFRYPGHEHDPLVDSMHGLIPDGWQHRPFSELASFVNGFAFKPSHWGTTGRPIIKIKELKQGVTQTTPRCPEEHIDTKFWIEPGALLFSWSADLGVYRWSDEPGLLNQHLFVVSPLEDDVSATFLQHSLAGAMSQFWDRAQGTTMRHIKRSALSEVATLVPPSRLVAAFTASVNPLLDEALTLQRCGRALAHMRDLLLPSLVTGRINLSNVDPDALAGVEVA